MTAWRAIALFALSVVCTVVVTKYASIPLKLLAPWSPSVAHYFDLIENDSSSGISAVFFFMFAGPICAVIWFCYMLARLERDAGWLSDLLVFSALILVPQVIFYGGWGAEGWWILPAALGQSAFGVVAAAGSFRLARRLLLTNYLGTAPDAH